MYEDIVSIIDDFELLGPSADNFMDGFRDRYGTYATGRMEDDPEQLEYEEILALGQSLGGVSDASEF